MAATLTAIETKIRRLTRSPSEDQITTAQIDDYINTAILYDLPEHIRVRTLRTTVTWYTQKYLDTYRVDTTLDVNDPLYDFENRYVTIDTPLYIAGVRSFYTQSQDVFYGAFPKNSFIETIGTGDGAETVFTGTLSNIPILQSSVIFSAADSNSNTYTYRDGPTAGNIITSNLYNVSTATSTVGDGINYIDGTYRITFEAAPGDGELVTVQTQPYTAARPSALLYYNQSRIDSDGAVVNNKVFTVRSVPDGAYAVNIEAYRQPVALLAAGDHPDLDQWWQYIAYLGAKKIFEDRMDTESVQQIMPELKTQESLCLRKTVVQATTQRAATIYSSQLDGNQSYGTCGGTWQGPLG